MVAMEEGGAEEAAAEIEAEEEENAHTIGEIEIEVEIEAETAVEIGIGVEIGTEGAGTEKEIDHPLLVVTEVEVRSPADKMRKFNGQKRS